VTNDRALIVLAAAAAIGLFVVAIVYFAEPAGSLPGFFPGYTAGSGHHHVKHGVAAVLLGCACLVFAWFRSGSRSSAPAR